MSGLKKLKALSSLCRLRSARHDDDSSDEKASLLSRPPRHLCWLFATDSAWWWWWWWQPTCMSHCIVKSGDCNQRLPPPTSIASVHIGASGEGPAVQAVCFTLNQHRHPPPSPAEHKDRPLGCVIGV